jgi:hypothetical protein
MRSIFTLVASAALGAALAAGAPSEAAAKSRVGDGGTSAAYPDDAMPAGPYEEVSEPELVPHWDDQERRDYAWGPWGWNWRWWSSDGLGWGGWGSGAYVWEPVPSARQYSYPPGYYKYGNPFDFSYPNGAGSPPAAQAARSAAAPPPATGRSVATGPLGNYCATPVITCELRHAAYAGAGCSCRVSGGRARGVVTR